jgi:hypothetical protein
MKSRDGKSLRREEKYKEDQRRERIRRKKMQEKSRNNVFSNVLPRRRVKK